MNEKTIIILCIIIIIIFVVGVFVLSASSSLQADKEWKVQRKICDNLCVNKNGIHIPDGMNTEGQCKCKIDNELKIFIYNN